MGFDAQGEVPVDQPDFLVISVLGGGGSSAVSSHLVDHRVVEVLVQVLRYHRTKAWAEGTRTSLFRAWNR